MLSSLCRSCVALVYPALVGAVFISTEGALRLPKTSDNHPSNQPNPILTYSIEDDLSANSDYYILTILTISDYI